MDAHKTIKGKKTDQARVGAVPANGVAHADGARKPNQSDTGIRHARADASYPEYDADRQYGAGQKKKK